MVDFDLEEDLEIFFMGSSSAGTTIFFVRAVSER